MILALPLSIIGLMALGLSIVVAHRRTTAA
jgi:hypothetical protein